MKRSRNDMESTWSNEAEHVGYSGVYPQQPEIYGISPQELMRPSQTPMQQDEFDRSGTSTPTTPSFPPTHMSQSTTPALQSASTTRHPRTASSRSQSISSASTPAPARTALRGRAAFIAAGKKRPFQETCLKMLDQFCKKDEYMFFHAPVDVTQVPDYVNIIKNPMDLGTMRDKLMNGDYASLEAFRDDVRLIVENCKTFNPSDSIYYKWANILWRYADKMITRDAPYIAEPDENPQPDASTPTPSDKSAQPPAPVESEFTASGKRKIQRRELGTIPRWLDGIRPDGSLDPEFYEDIPEDLAAEPWDRAVWDRYRQEDTKRMGFRELKQPVLGVTEVIREPRKATGLDYGPFPRCDFGEPLLKLSDQDGRIRIAPAAPRTDIFDVQDPWIRELPERYSAGLQYPSWWKALHFPRPARLPYVQRVWHGDVRAEAYARSVESFLEGCPEGLKEKELARMDRVVGGGYGLVKGVWSKLVSEKADPAPAEASNP